MNDSACERWMELSDRAAVGEALTDEEARFEREHPACCAGCAAEASVYETLGRWLSSEDERSLTEETTTLPAARVAPLHGPQRSRRRRALLIGSAAAAALAAAVAFWNVGATDPEPQATRLEDVPVSLMLVAGRVQVSGTQAAAGAALRPSDGLRVERGQVCLSYGRGIAACAGAGAELQLLSPGDGRRRLVLASGAVVCRLDAQPLRTRFSVETPAGRVTAKGTVFAVEHAGPGEVAVRVHRGVVEIELPDGRREDLAAPGSAVLSGGIRRTRNDGEAWQRDAGLSSLAELWRDGAITPLELAVRPLNTRVMLDGIDLGESPVSTLVGRGEHELSLAHPGYVAHVERFAVLGAERVSRSIELVALPDTAVEAAVPSAAVEPVAAPSPAQLLARARTLRSSRRYAEAAASYRQLMSVHPGSGEARAALLSLGELQLSQLGQPAAALSSFESYLARGGALAQEARYGRIRALRRLGREGDARQAAEEFQRDYPGSAQARSLGERAAP